MSFFDTAVERAATVAGGCWVVATQGNPIIQGAAAVVVGGAGLMALVHEATKGSRVECETHVKKLARTTKERLTATHPEYATEYEDASQRLSEYLLDSFPSPDRLAALAVSEFGVIAAATEAVMDDLAQKGLGFDRDEAYECFAREVVGAALECAFHDREHFPKVEPHLWIAALQSIAAVKQNTELLLGGQFRVLSAQERMETKIDELHAAARGDARVSEREHLPLSAELQDLKKRAQAASRKHKDEDARTLWETVSRLAEDEGHAVEAILAQSEIALILVQTEGNPSAALKFADSCLQRTRGVGLGEKRSRVLRMLGEVHRINGNLDRARGFLASALEAARSNNSKDDEGFALLAMAALAKAADRNGRAQSKSVELIDLAYNAFTSLLTSADAEGQTTAHRGFALCHLLKADVLQLSREHDALAEWSRAIRLFRELGEDNTWDLADSLMCRSKLHAHLGDKEAAAADLSEAQKTFLELGNDVGLARCCLEGAELLEHVGDRAGAAAYYEHAAAIAAGWRNDRKASYYYFRHALKLFELGKTKEARAILIFLADADWLEPPLRLTVVSQLCLLARASKAEGDLQKWCGVALGLVAELSRDADSAEERGRVLLEKAHYLELIGQIENAIATCKEAARGFESIDDSLGCIQAWSRIRGVMQHIRNRRGEREAAEKVLALGAEEIAPIMAALTLVMLAQLNIEEQRYAEAEQQLDQAVRIEFKDPMVNLIAADLRSKLPQLMPHSHRGPPPAQPRHHDFPDLIRELHEWCAQFPQKRKSILHVWYTIRSADLWAMFRTMLGVKFLINVPKVERFERIRSGLQAQGDLFVWGAQFDLKADSMKTEAAVDKVPMPEGLRNPIDVLVFYERNSEIVAYALGSNRKDALPISSLPRRPYYLTRMADGASSAFFFVGRKHKWRDMQVAKFMLGSPTDALIAQRSICLPLSEGSVVANLGHTMRTAFENGAIPVFQDRLPSSDDIACEYDCSVVLATGDSMDAARLKDSWLRLLESCADSPRRALQEFVDSVGRRDSVESVAGEVVRIYLLRFRFEGKEIVHPAVAVLSGRTSDAKPRASVQGPAGS